MTFKKYLYSERIYLRSVKFSDIDNGYLDWLNDPEVNQYLETRFSFQSKIKIQEFITQQNLNPNSYFFAICMNENDEHIGNIKLGPVNLIHRRGNLSYLIGKKNFCGKGIGSEAVELIINFAKYNLNLYKLDAGVYEENLGSFKVLVKNGFKEQGRLKNHWFHKGKYQDEILLSKIL